jgi:hypothetical protein
MANESSTIVQRHGNEIKKAVTPATPTAAR